jgi:hypothetical protein
MSNFIRRIVVSSVAAGSICVAFAQEFRITEGKGYTVCESYLKNLNAFPTFNFQRVCAQELHPSRHDFHQPTWRNLPLDSHQRLIYDIEKRSNGFPVQNVDLTSFENWKRQFAKRSFKPHLRVTDVRAPALALQGTITILEYDPSPTVCEDFLRDTGRPYAERKDYYVYSPKATSAPQRILLASFPSLQHELLLYGRAPIFLSPGARTKVEYDDKGKFIRQLSADAVEMSLSILERTYENEPIAMSRCQFETPTKVIVETKSGE